MPASPASKMLRAMSMNRNPAFPLCQETAYNLLFGLLALQNNFISRDILVCAFGTWIADKSKSLDNILLDQGDIDGECHALLTGLVRQHLKLHGDDPYKSLADLSAIASVLRRLLALDDPDLTASLGHVAAAHPIDRDSDLDATSTFVGAPTSLRGRFQVLRLHAEGGLGQVSVALDHELHREVALKQIRPDHAYEAESLARFLIEAEITSRLEHPGIVPIYGLGKGTDGRPYYAMRFIDGESLKNAVSRLHQKESSHDLNRFYTGLRHLLGRFVAVCHSIGYAHSRGVLHRDIKPGNIMLGPFGETLVVDWGLARLITDSDGGTDTQERRVRLSFQRTTSTQVGSLVGTPAFMSPEQACGDLDKLGPASDVYSLGATLYFILTGRAAFEEADVGLILERVRRGVFAAPHHVNPAISPDLGRICLKAMALQIEERYSSPLAMLKDIELWLASAEGRVRRAEQMASVGMLSSGVASEISEPLFAAGENLAALEHEVEGIVELVLAIESAQPVLESTEPEILGHITAICQKHDLPHFCVKLGRLLAEVQKSLSHAANVGKQLQGLAPTSRSQKESVSVSDLVENTLETMRGRFKQQRVEVVVHCHDPARLECVPYQIRQVLLNLLTNALQAIETFDRPEGGRIEVDARQLGQTIALTVSDNGCGILPEVQAPMFLPFFSTKAQGEAMGLGLSICHGIVTDHGGHIEVESYPNKGSCFRVYLPSS